MYGETLDFQSEHQQWLYEIPDRKINFCIKLVVKTLPLMLTLEVKSLSIHYLISI